MNDKESHIQLWMQKAEHDSVTAKITYLHLPQYYDTIAFHCQQAVEKYMKAMLVFCGIPFIRTHNLVYLSTLLADKIEITEELQQNAILLNSFSVEIRYPNQLIPLTKTELEVAIKTAEDFKSVVKKVVEQPL